MKSYSAYYVRAKAIDIASAEFVNVEPLPDSPWLICAYRPSDSPPKDDVLFGEESLTRTKSEQLGEVIFVYRDISQDWFVYEHAQDGKLLRKLVWASLLDDDWNAGWVCVDGEPEAWESALFTQSKLSQTMELELQRLEDEGRSDEASDLKAEITEVWKLGEIPAGKTYPSCDGTVTVLVEKGFGIKRVE